ncbi:unnamed protein product [Moneuplotes crassus]|uniref:Cytochrome P450 n=1 Tax=Euplotes crassus TaxID=5936 RepID=A0AAD1UG99_EUPCR|nr:unnamed protein product [Moneuplotes crassus]
MEANTFDVLYDTLLGYIVEGMKYSFALSVLVGLYLLYRFFFIPYMIKRHYMKHSVTCSPRDESYNQFRRSTNKHVERCKDFKLYFQKTWHHLELCSIKSIEEFQKKVPEDFDRSDHFASYSYQAIQDAMCFKTKDDESKPKMYHLSKCLGVSFFLSKMPLIASLILRRVNTIRRDELVDFLKYSQMITLEIMCHMLFGEDFQEKINYAHYRHADGYVETCSYFTLFPRILEDSEAQRDDIKAHMFQFLSKNYAIDPFKRNMYNITEMMRILTDFTNISTDKNSMYKILSNSEDYSQYEAFVECVSFLFASAETLPHAMCSILYQVRKSEQIYLKLKQDLRHLEDNFKQVDAEHLKEQLDSCDLLTYVIKEGLRIDPPMAQSNLYKAVEGSAEICDVPIRKDTLVSVNILAAHMDPDEWENPSEFNPERFNPLSKDFMRPDEKKGQRSNYSFIPFSVGKRSCLGQSLSLNLLKIFVGQILASYGYSLEGSQEGQSHMSFCRMSKNILKLKIHKGDY